VNYIGVNRRMLAGGQGIMDDMIEMARDFTEIPHPRRMETLWAQSKKPAEGLRLGRDLLRLIDHERTDVVNFIERMEERCDTAIPNGAGAPDPAPPPISDAPSGKDGALHSIRTLGDVINYYRAKDARYHRLRYKTRVFYNNNIERILQKYGDTNLADINKQEIERFYFEWSDGGKKKPMGHSMVTMLRIFINFGATDAENKECMRIAMVLRHMHFRPPRERTERITREQIALIIERAHRQGRDSLALGQGIQFECPVRQIDTIGQWIPKDEEESEKSDVTYQDQKWIRGLRWEAIDQANWTMRVTSASKVIEVDLKECPFVMAELKRMEKIPTTGPVIIDEDTGLPYFADKYRALWRTIANAAGVPKDVKNMDSPGGKGLPKAKPSPATADR
jgi:hypothetical protein